VHANADLVEVAVPVTRSGSELQHLYDTIGRDNPPAQEPPRLDGDGLLWNGRRWVVVPEAQLAVVQLVLDNPDQLVQTTSIRSTYMRTGSSGHPASIRTMVNRVANRFREVGLTLHLVRSKGVIFEWPPR
jgi:hypothetical protein